MRNLKKYGLAAALLLACACKGDGTGSGPPPVIPPEPKPIGPPVTVRALTETFRSGSVGTAAEAPAVMVYDANSTPVPNAPVTFTLSQGGGTMVGVPQATDARGIAALSSWILPTKPGWASVNVAVANLAPIEFRVYVNHEPPSVVEVLSGNDQTITAGASTTLRVRLLDRYGNLSPWEVRFAVIEGRATVSPAQLRAGTDAVATAQLTASSALAPGELIRVAVRPTFWPDSHPAQVITLRGA
jgi:hypothetical protein